MDSDLPHSSQKMKGTGSIQLLNTIRRTERNDDKAKHGEGVTLGGNVKTWEGHASERKKKTNRVNTKIKDKIGSYLRGTGGWAPKLLTTIPMEKTHPIERGS